jgi:molybdenum cofactor cytidylyltransferase
VVVHVSLLDTQQPRPHENNRSGVVALVLAAGGGRRFGPGTKQLAELDGRPLVAHAVDTAWRAGVDRVLVVVGHDADAVAAGARHGVGDRDIEVVVNPDHASGQASSLAAGVGALLGSAVVPKAVVVLLADQPAVAAETVRAVGAAVLAGARAARASYADRASHPVAFAPDLLPELTGLRGDVGARQLFDELDVVHVLVGGTAPPDVDTASDLARLRDRAVAPDATG